MPLAHKSLYVDKDGTWVYATPDKMLNHPLVQFRMGMVTDTIWLLQKQVDPKMVSELKQRIAYIKEW